MKTSLNRNRARAAALNRGLFVLLAIISPIAMHPKMLSASQPNVILMMADDLGWGDTGYNGHPVLKTPHLDQMAQAGLKFERFYAAAPVCSPTRGSCLTGRHPYRFGVYTANKGHIKSQELTLAELLKANGYRTGHFGKWHLGTLTTEVKDANRGAPGNTADFAPPWLNGFDVSFSTESKVPTWDPLLRPKSASGGKHWFPVVDANDANPYGTFYWDNGKQVTEGLRGDDSKVIMDRATKFIEAAANDEQPFFAIVWFHAPHLPVVAGPKYTAMYAEQDDYTQNYYGCITALDEQVGRLRNELRRLGIADNTLLTFCSDNGPEGNENAPGSAKNLRGRKRSLYEGGVRVPGIIEWPAKIASGSTTQFAAVTSDYLPTIVDLVGAKMLDRRPLDGVSLLPVFENNSAARSQPIGFQSKEMRTWVGNRYKLFVKGEGEKAVAELYDLQEDPSESKNLASLKPQLVKEMFEQMEKWQASCRASDAEKDYH